MIRQGWQVWLFGSKNDHPVGEQIRDRLIPGLREESSNLAGETSLAEAIDLMSCAHAVVSNDSGLMHMAAAAGAPTIGLFGPSDERLYGPWGLNTKVVRGIRTLDQIREVDPKLSQALCHMMDLPVDWVTAAAKDLLAQTK